MVKNPPANAKDAGSVPESGRSPGEGNGHSFCSTPVFLPGESHGQRRLMVYSPWGCKRAGHDLETEQQQITGHTGTYCMPGAIKIALYS